MAAVAFGGEDRADFLFEEIQLIHRLSEKRAGQE
jgi:hypothetical protein